MQAYDPKLFEVMQNTHRETEMYGTKVQLKIVPDDDREGVMDPRELQMAKERADAFTKMAHSQNAAPASRSVEDMRKMMGFPNRNMNTVEIWTKYEEHDFDGNMVKFWIYYPRKPEGKTGRPAFIYIHGGGWVGGTPFTVENPCRLIAERADAVVFNVDYSLAPEKPFPNAFNDCFSTLKYIYDHADDYGIDKEKIGMGGDSAGGNLTAVVAVKDRDLGTHMLKYQALLYPAVTLGALKDAGFEWKLSDYVINEEQYPLIEPGIRLGRPTEKDGSGVDGSANTYLEGDLSQIENPYVSPIYADKKGLCKCLIAGAEFDGLRISNEIYGKLLRDAGVDTRILRYCGVGHAFLDKLGILPQAEDVCQEIVNDLLTL